MDEYKNTLKLNGETLIQILFNLIKRRVEFKELLQELCKINDQINLTQLILF